MTGIKTRAATEPRRAPSCALRGGPLPARTVALRSRTVATPDTRPRTPESQRRVEEGSSLAQRPPRAQAAACACLAVAINRARHEQEQAPLWARGGLGGQVGRRAR